MVFVILASATNSQCFHNNFTWQTSFKFLTCRTTSKHEGCSNLVVLLQHGRKHIKNQKKGNLLILTIKIGNSNPSNLVQLLGIYSPPPEHKSNSKNTPTRIYSSLLHKITVKPRATSSRLKQCEKIYNREKKHKQV